jgi:hypothetical protein
MHRALWCLALSASAAAIPSTAWADELQSTGIEGGFFLFSEQEAGWVQSTPEAARTSIRLGYGIETPQFNLGFEAGPRFINGVNAVNRTDWSLMLEGAWVPKRTSLEIYGEYAPAWETKAGNEGLQQEAKWGLLIPLSASSEPEFDIGQGFAAASGYYLKVEQEGLWSVGGSQEYLWTRPRLGYGLSEGALSMDVEAGPSFRWSDAQSPHTDAAGLIDVRYSTNERWELYVQYEPRYRFQAEQPGLIQILRGGLVFSF